MEALKDIERVKIDTPFGSPSVAAIVGTLDGTPVAFLAEHSHNHTFFCPQSALPGKYLCHEVWGVVFNLSVGGWFPQAEAKPLDMVVPDRFIVVQNRFLARKRLLLTSHSAIRRLPQVAKYWQVR